ncbi:MAG: VanZ family protein [Calditrichaeota bacterium]|nr:VanZ family protein [Calditrichota bacterium]HQU71645.1 VanZ family protein [Calditrichia bacterium]
MFSRMNVSGRIPGIQLSTALLWYMVLLVALVTLMPFEFQLNGRHRLSMIAGVGDVVGNIILFLPLGFLFQLSRKIDRQIRTWPVFLYGFAGSFVVEMLQLFLPDRYTSPADMLSNALGAWLGALGADALNRYFATGEKGTSVLELPLTQLVYLLIPLMWINGMSVFGDKYRLWLLVLLSFTAAVLLAELYNHRLRHATDLRKWQFIAGACSYFSLGIMPAYMRYPEESLLIAFLATTTVATLIIPKPGRSASERRFERVVLRKILFFFALYLFLMSIWPIPMKTAFRITLIGLDTLGRNSSIPYILRLLEYVGGFTLLGFMVGEYLGRFQGSKTQLRLLEILLLGGSAILLEGLRSFQGDYRFSLFQLGVSMLLGWYGMLLFHLQLRALKKGAPKAEPGKQSIQEPSRKTALTALGEKPHPIPQNRAI